VKSGVEQRLEHVDRALGFIGPPQRRQLDEYFGVVATLGEKPAHSL
jgi:hypothetical protein